MIGCRVCSFLFPKVQKVFLNRAKTRVTVKNKAAGLMVQGMHGLMLSTVHY